MCARNKEMLNEWRGNIKGREKQGLSRHKGLAVDKSGQI